MAKVQQRRKPAPQTGRLVVLTAVVIGAGAMLGYGLAQVQGRKEGKTVAADDMEAAPAPAPTGSALVERAVLARRSLDTATLQRLEGELASAAPQAPDARREQLAVLAALAVESSVRGAVAGDAKAREQATGYATRARTLVDGHEAELDPGVVLATRARLDLVGGQDVLARHPAVLLPGFRDRELQHLLVSEPLWRPGSEPLAAPARAGLAQALEQLPEPTAVERLLLALALPDSDARARSLVGEVLTKAPAQPLATAVQERLRGATQVAVADPLPVEPAEPEPEPQPAEPEPEPAEPIDTQPEPTKKPSQPKPPKPKEPKAPTGDLAEEGCKLVQSGKAEQGFSMLQRAFDQDPRDTKVVLCMAEGHMKLGRLPSARAMVERVLRGSGKNKKALLLAAKIEDKLGNERSAADYYGKILELEPDNATAKAYVEKHGG